MKNISAYYFSEIQQDTLIQPLPLRTQQHQQHQPLPDLNVRRPQLNLERAEELFRQSELREQEIIALQQPVRLAAPKKETVRKPSIETDTLLIKYRHIGCSPRPNFPDTFSLTVLERYYQPMNMPDSTTFKTIQSLNPSDRYAGDVRQEGYPSSVTLFLICGLALLTAIKYNFGRNLPDMFLSFFNYHRALRMIEERRESDRQAAMFSDALFVLISGIFIAIALPFFGATPLWGNYALSILFFSAATALLYFVKVWAWRLLGLIFRIQSFSKLYAYQLFLYNRNTGLAIFPLVAAIPFVTASVTPIIIYSVIGIYIFSYIFRQFRNFQMIHDQNISLFYFILYLCTLEILPLLLFIKGCKILSENYLFL